MRAGDSHQHNLVRGLEHPHTVNDRGLHDAPTLARLGDNRLDRFLGHARVVFQRQRTDTLAFVHVAHQADEGRHGTHFRFAQTQCVNFRSEIEVGRLDTHRHVSLR